MDTWTLRQALIKNLAAASAGQGGTFDVFSADLDKQQSQAALALSARPGAGPVAVTPDSDTPDPAALDTEL